MMRLLLLPLFGSSLAFAQVGPNYERPVSTVATHYKNGITWRETQPLDHLPKGEWWKAFKDPKLNELMTLATANNQQLKVAIARFDQARASARLARAEFFPSLNLLGSMVHQQTSENAPSPIPLNGLRYDGPVYDGTADFSWEVDLWGKLRRQSEGARAKAMGAADGIHNALLGIQTDMAINYFQLRALDGELDTVVKAINWRREAFNIAKGRVDAGAGSSLEQSQSETEVATAEAEVSVLQTQRAQLENAIAILAGKNPSLFRVLPAKSGLRSPPTIHAGLPSDLLQRRPDVAQAERNLMAASAQIGYIKSLAFPSLKLLGTGGFQSADIDMFLEPNSTLWSIGPKLTVPVFSGGKRRASVDNAKAAHDEALATYRQTILGAFADVENSLVSIRNLGVQAEARRRAQNSAEQAATIAQDGFKAGTGAYLGVIEANRSLLLTQRASVQLAGQRLIASVQLIKALGGGWDETLPVSLPVTNPDPAAQLPPPGSEEKRGIFSWTKGLFNKKDKKD